VHSSGEKNVFYKVRDINSRGLITRALFQNPGFSVCLDKCVTVNAFLEKAFTLAGMDQSFQNLPPQGWPEKKHVEATTNLQNYRCWRQSRFQRICKGFRLLYGRGPSMKHLWNIRFFFYTIHACLGRWPKKLAYKMAFYCFGLILIFWFVKHMLSMLFRSLSACSACA
jgi:hypothetical protein